MREEKRKERERERESERERERDMSSFSSTCRGSIGPYRKRVTES